MSDDDLEIPTECEDYESDLVHIVIRAYWDKKISTELAWCLLEANRQIDLLDQRIKWIMDWIPSSDKKHLTKEGECPFFSSKDAFYDFNGAKERMKDYKKITDSLKENL